MPSNRWPRRFARALRDTAIHAHMRADMLPRLPFVIALVVSAVALVAAIEYRPAADARVVSVEEQSSDTPEEYTDEAAFTGEEVELEIVESGFSRVADASGEEQVLAAVVLHNPYDGELVPGTLTINTETARGYPVNLDSMYVGSLPPHSTAAVGYVLANDVSGVDVEDMTVEFTDPSLLYPPDADHDWGPIEAESHPLPVFTITGIDPLVSPDGYRVRFSAVTAEETDAQISVMFRDGEGKLLGGLPADTESEVVSGGYRTLPKGESEQYLDFASTWIPEGADLDRIEIGPSRY